MYVKLDHIFIAWQIVMTHYLFIGWYFYKRLFANSHRLVFLCDQIIRPTQNYNAATINQLIAVSCCFTTYHAH